MSVLGWKDDTLWTAVENIIGKDNADGVKRVKDDINIAKSSGWEGLWDKYIGGYVNNIADGVLDSLTSYLRNRVLIAAVTVSIHVQSGWSNCSKGFLLLIAYISSSVISSNKCLSW